MREPRTKIKVELQNKRRGRSEEKRGNKSSGRGQPVDLHRLDRSNPPSFREVGFDLGFELDVCEHAHGRKKGEEFSSSS